MYVLAHFTEIRHSYLLARLRQRDIRTEAHHIQCLSCGLPNGFVYFDAASYRVVRPFHRGRRQYCAHNPIVLSENSYVLEASREILFQFSERELFRMEGI